ncbi:MAG TPA: Rieske 2Fe-2S domain-containing protein [Tepidisphaeraceae bacterium]|jgi:nitrite reductase/ring-hydroxylating ferredoxin subunit|nr:Rieske 2Fe-2S domain-containing protein [Tepidisphaeraceae bacterium]
MYEYPTRRQFLIASGATLCLAAFGGMARAAEIFAAASKEESYDAGPLSDFGEGIADTFANSYPNFFVVRTKDRLFVSSSFCTKERCVVRRTGAGYSCTCHRCKFTPEGVPLRGPAYKPLPRYAVKLDDRKHVIVDLTRQFEQDEWDKPDASVKVAL